MSNGGAFKLLSNDGKQDDMLMATRFLNTRLQKIQSIRASDPRIDNPTPTLADIEKTHLLFVNAHFKPFVSIANEYQTVNQTGAAFGSKVLFSIPLYGDFIHDMVMKVKIDSVAATNTGAGDKLIRYVDYPGEKLCKTTEFTVNGNPLDKYESDVFPFHREFCVQPNKKAGYDKMMGQQTEIEGELLSAGGRLGGKVQKTRIVTGPQVPKTVQPELELWIPILFWFSTDVRTSLVSVSIPHGQRFLQIEIANADEILQHQGLSAQDDSPGSFPVPVPRMDCTLYVNNIFVNPEIHTIIIKRIGFNLIRVFRFHRAIIDKPSGEILLSQIKWPIETLYIGGRPTVNYSRLNPNMPKNWDKFSFSSELTANSGAMDTNAYYWDTFGNSPAQAADYTAALLRSDGKPHNLNFATYLNVPTTTVLSVAQVNTVLTRNGYQPLAGTFVNASAPTNAEILTATPNSGALVSYTKCEPTFDNIGLKAHGIELFKNFGNTFYNSYLPWHYGTEKIQTPKDCGKLMMNFNMYPGSYQPSGHINVSRAREFYLNYDSSRIGTNTPVELFIIGIALNFLLITDGSAILRYST